MEVLRLDEIGRAIQARHLATPLGTALTLDPDDDANAARARLRERQFDCAPVVRDGQPLGTFSVTASGGRDVQGVMAELRPAHMVSADTPMGDVVQHLCAEPFLYVLEGRQVTGFVTPADLGSAAGRTHYYLLLAALEIALARLVRHRHPVQDAAIQLLSEGRQQKHAELVVKLRQTDDYIDDVAALSLMDLMSIARSDDRFLREATARGRTWKWLKSGLVQFRNDVMHPARDFTHAWSGAIEQLAEFDERLASLLHAAEAALEPEAQHQRAPELAPAPSGR